MGSVVCHFTVGKNSAPVGARGYFQFLVGRDGAVTQFAEADAVCWHAGDPWNGRGPGIEVEYLPGVDNEIFTPEAYTATALLCQWLHDTYSIPLDFYDGPRVSFHDGFITHRSLIQTGDAHSDYWPELPRVQSPAPPTRSPDVAILAREPGVSAWLVHEGRTIGIDQIQWDEFSKQPGAYVFDGLSHEKLVEIVFPPTPSVGKVTVDLPSSYTVTPNP